MLTHTILVAAFLGAPPIWDPHSMPFFPGQVTPPIPPTIAYSNCPPRLNACERDLYRAAIAAMGLADVRLEKLKKEEANHAITKEERDRLLQELNTLPVVVQETPDWVWPLVAGGSTFTFIVGFLVAMFVS